MTTSYDPIPSHALVCWCGEPATYLDHVDPVVTPASGVVDGGPVTPHCDAHPGSLGGWRVDDLLGVFPILAHERDRFWWAPTVVGVPVEGVRA